MERIKSWQLKSCAAKDSMCVWGGGEISKGKKGEHSCCFATCEIHLLVSLGVQLPCLLPKVLMGDPSLPEQKINFSQHSICLPVDELFPNGIWFSWIYSSLKNHLLKHLVNNSGCLAWWKVCRGLLDLIMGRDLMACLTPTGYYCLLVGWLCLVRGLRLIWKPVAYFLPVKLWHLSFFFKKKAVWITHVPKDWFSTPTVNSSIFHSAICCGFTGISCKPGGKVCTQHAFIQEQIVWKK